jgi:hypothetical protein
LTHDEREREREREGERERETKAKANIIPERSSRTSEFRQAKQMHFVTGHGKLISFTCGLD